MYTLIKPFGRLIKSNCLSYQSNIKNKERGTLEIFEDTIFHLSQIAI